MRTLADLPKCSVCQSPLRPYNSRKGDWPGTSGKVSSNPLRCTTHQENKKNVKRKRKPGSRHAYFGPETGNAPSTKPNVSGDEVRIVRRLIRDRLEGDDYLLVVDALGIGADID